MSLAVFEDHRGPIGARVRSAGRVIELGRARWAVLLWVATVVPALAAIWSVPWFVTQDGPAHAYNAEILAASVGSTGHFGAFSPRRDIFVVKWQPIPNWAGSLALAALIARLPAWVADRVLTSVTLVGFAAAILWLRWRVAGERGILVAAIFAPVVAMNMMWVYGFTSFMLGAMLFAITLGVWWPVRDELTWPRQLLLAVLLSVGYFCHLVSLGLTVLALLVLAALCPEKRGLDASNGWQVRKWRLLRIGVCMLPVVFLGLCYVRIATGRAPLHPIWRNYTDLTSVRGWVARLGWVDPLSLSIRDGLPFTEREGWPFLILAPTLWIAIAMIVWVFRLALAKSGAWPEAERRGWFVLTAILMAGGVLGPDLLGEAHGDYLPQRVLLLGLVALIPIFDVDLGRWSGRAIAGALSAALLLQSVVLWDYALYSNRTAGQVVQVRDQIVPGERIVGLMASTRSRFRANPLMHAVNWLGVETGGVVWNNYETLHYYFPVQFRDGLDRPRPDDLAWVELHDDPSDAASRSRAWEKILARNARDIDLVVVWKSNESLDAITAQWFDRVERRGDLQIFRRQSPADSRLPASHLNVRLAY
jgi:hypothetical protein